MCIAALLTMGILHSGAHLNVAAPADAISAVHSDASPDPAEKADAEHCDACALVGLAATLVVAPAVPPVRDAVASRVPQLHALHPLAETPPPIS